MPPALSPEGKTALDALLSTTVASRKVPAVWFGVATADGELYFDCKGKVDWSNEDSEDVDRETTLQLYSATKLITTVVCLQLVDQGLLSLDDPDVIAKHLPELTGLKVLKRHDGDRPIWEDQDGKRRITTRRLLSHTSGMAYPMNTPDIARWIKDNDVPGILAADITVDNFLYPLWAQPGTIWQYSVGIDWAGILAQRITGAVDLEEMYQRTIFHPLGMHSTSFRPTADICRRFVKIAVGDNDGVTGTCADGFTDLPVFSRERDPDKVGPVYAGGAGLFTTASDYLTFLGAIMRCAPGVENDAAPLLSTSSFAELFHDSLADPPVDKSILLQAMKGQTYHGANLTADETGGSAGHSVGLLLNHVDSDNGRKAGSGCWDGAAKTQYWLDPKTGIAAVCFTNLFAPNPNPFFRLYNDFERTLYAHLV